MPLFNPKNNTISDKKMASIQRRAQKAPQAAVFSPEAVKYRKASAEQRRKANQS